MQPSHPRLNIVSAILLFCSVLFLLNCKKSASNSLNSANPSGPQGYQYLAGSKQFLITCNSYDPYTNQNLGSSTSIVTDSIIVINATKIYLWNNKDTLTLESPVGTVVTYSNNNSYFNTHCIISYFPGSDTIYYSYGQKGENCSGYSTKTMSRSNPYQITMSGYSHYGDTITFHTNAPANATFNWSLGDNNTSTLANPSHAYNANSSTLLSSYYVSVTITVNDTPFFCGLNLNVGLDPQTFSGNKTWTKSINVRFLQSPYYDTTYTLYDTTFSITDQHDSLFIWGKYYCLNGNNVQDPYDLYYYCSANNYTLNYHLNGNTHSLVLSYPYSASDTSYIINYAAH